MKKLVMVFLVIALTACASQIMHAYVGKDIREVMLDYGPPINAFDMGNGKRAFQWIMNNSYTTPSYAQTNGSATTTGLVTSSNTVNYQTWINSNTVITGGQTINNQCVYTLFGSWNESANSWTIVDFRKPKLDCE